LRDQGYYTCMMSPFGERHGAMHIYAGFNEILNTFGKGGNEIADEVHPVVMDWMERKGADDNWFVYLNLWDPHTPYRSPSEEIAALADQPLPEWYTEGVRQQHWQGCGPHSAQEVNAFTPTTPWTDGFDHQPTQIASMDDARAMFDGYDAGVHYADRYLGKLIDKLDELGVLDDTAIIITADHGENLGELNIYGDHQTADHVTCNIPMIVRWPGVTDPRAGQAEDALIHHFDVAAAAVDISGGWIPPTWDARSARSLLDGSGSAIRDALVCSNLAWTCQRGVRFDQYMLTRSYHDGYHLFPDYMLFNVVEDPHEQHDLAEERPDLVAKGCALLDRWLGEMARTATTPQDPLWTVLHEGGPFHTRGQLPAYLERLRATGRSGCADALAAKFPAEC
ncbi:MAG: sulfatase family protein, partial [Planctomycetota bacterium]